MVTFAVASDPRRPAGRPAGPTRASSGGLRCHGAPGPPPVRPRARVGVAPRRPGRAGAGAALVMASAPALVTLATEPGRRGRALGWLGLAASVVRRAPSAAASSSGLSGWRVVYLGRLPLVALALGLGRGGLRGPGCRRGRPGRRAPAGRSRALAGLDRSRGLRRGQRAHLLATPALFAVWLLVPYYLIDRRGFPGGARRPPLRGGPLAQPARRRSGATRRSGASAAGSRPGAGRRGVGALADRAPRRWRGADPHRRWRSASPASARALHRRQHALRDGRAPAGPPGRGGRPGRAHADGRDRRRGERDDRGLRGAPLAHAGLGLRCRRRRGLRRRLRRRAAIAAAAALLTWCHPAAAARSGPPAPRGLPSRLGALTPLARSVYTPSRRRPSGRLDACADP